MMDNINEINIDKNPSRNLNKRKTEVFSINKYSFNSYDFQKELLFFKNEILKDIHDSEAKYNEKFINFTEEQNEIIKSYEKKFLEQEQKITYLSNMLQDFYKKEKFEKYFLEFTAKFEHSLTEVESKIYILKGEMKYLIDQLEKNMLEHLFYPGKIGTNFQFKDLHAFIDFVLDSIKQLGTYQEILKSYEIHKIKNNLLKEIKTVQLQVKNNFYNLTKFTTDKISESEQKMLNVLKEYNTQFVDVRLENNEHANKLQKKMDEVSNNFEQIIQIRKDIHLKNEEHDKKFENIIQNIEEKENKIIEQKNEINNIDTKFNLLTTYIDNQNTEFNNDNQNLNSRNNNSSKYNKTIRIQSAKDFIDRQLRLMSKGIITNKDDSNNNYRTLSETKIFNSEDNKIYDKYDNNSNTITNINQPQIKKSFIINKKLSFKGDSFIKKYITGKISIGDMYNHPNNAILRNNNNSNNNNIKNDNYDSNNINHNNDKNDRYNNNKNNDNKNSVINNKKINNINNNKNNNNKNNRNDMNDDINYNINNKSSNLYNNMNNNINNNIDNIKFNLNNNKIKHEIIPSKINTNFIAKKDNSKLLNFTKLQSSLANTENKKLQSLNIDNSNLTNNKIITQSFSDGNYNSLKSKLIKNENFIKGMNSINSINNIFNKRNNINLFISPSNTYQKSSYNKYIESQLIREKKYGKKRNKLLIIQ